MFGNTLTLPHADGNIVATRINQDGYSSEYLFRSTVHEYRVKIRHQHNATTLRDRHNIEVTQTVFPTASTPQVDRKVYLVIEQMPGDIDVKNTDALADWLIATANANVTSLLGWES